MIQKLSLPVILCIVISGATTPSVLASNLKIRTTAYTHTESDHVQYQNKNAMGTNLKYGSVRSAASDWSIFPLGTTFRIAGESCLYEIDDYGSALVGKSTIDLYKPSRRAMNAWGVRNVNIEIVKWGSFEESLDVLKSRTRYGHVRRMVARIRQKL